MAERLETLTDGLVKVVYCPEAFDAGQGAGSAGHRYYCYLEDELTEFWLDDQQPEPLTPQLAERLRQVAATLNKLAEQIEASPAVL
jgi:hypothetical protein